MITLHCDQADVDTLAIAHIFILADGPEKITVRGIRYIDKFERGTDGWRIIHRQHDSLWQYTAAASQVTAVK